MLNEEKIRLMTGIAMYEKKAEKEIFPVTRYFKSDYIGSHMIRSFLTYTFMSVCILGLWVLYQIEDILNTMDFSVLLDSAKYIGILYAAGLVLYLLLTYIVYARRYDKAAKSMKIYQAKLRRLDKKYNSLTGQKQGEEERQS
ncbi:MAG: hypothetical protein IJ374_02095 [Lachnospiraceae bacterium]|nr:hypothetical protein [Lachnospiraceae bacterium]